MIRCAVICLCQPSRGPRWPDHARRLMKRLPAANPGWAFETFLLDGTQESRPGDGKFSRHARARNAAVEHVLGRTYAESATPIDWDYILWIDSDLVDWPADFPTRAVALKHWH